MHTISKPRAEIKILKNHLQSIPIRKYSVLASIDINDFDFETCRKMGIVCKDKNSRKMIFVTQICPYFELYKHMIQDVRSF